MVDCMCYSFCPKAGNFECNSRCIKNIELTYLLKNCGVPMKRQCLTPLIDSEVDKKAIEAVRSLAADIVSVVNNGTNIIFYSNKLVMAKLQWLLISCCLISMKFGQETVLEIEGISYMCLHT